MKKFKLFINLLLILILAFSIPVSAHRGRTDANGGHYDNETGEYHYHHGYEAHKHINGICPYNHDDQTKHQEGISSNSSVTKKPELHLETPDPHPAVIFTPSPHPTVYNTVHRSKSAYIKSFYTSIPNGLFQTLYIFIIVLLCVVLYRLLTLLYKLINPPPINKTIQPPIQKTSEQSTISELPEKTIQKYPEGYGIDENELPYKLNRIYGWGKEFNVFVTQKGHCYHRSYCKALKGKGKIHHLLHRYTALQMGYDPCHYCLPNDKIDDWYMEQFPNSPYSTITPQKHEQITLQDT